VAPSRRQLLRAAAAAATGVGLAGCTDGDPSLPGGSTGSPPDPCRRAFGDRDGTDDCTAVSFESVYTEPVSTATTEPGETPYEGTFSDRLTVAVRTGGESVAVRGCVRGSVDGETTRRAVKRTLPAGTSVHRFTVGPFDHPGGVGDYHL
jgi:hypothetical protein